MSNVDELLPSADAAKYVHLSISQLAKLTRDGEIDEAVKAPGLRGARFYRRADLDAYLARRAS